MTQCNTGHLRNGMKYITRPNVKGQTHDAFRGPPSHKGLVEAVMSKAEKKEMEFIDELLDDSKGGE